jgi:hypothetical protein
MEREVDLSHSMSLREVQAKTKQVYIKGLVVGRPPHYQKSLQQEMQHAQPHDLLSIEGAEALTNISYNQDQLDCLSYHSISIREILLPVVSAFSPMPQDMGVVMNFCT